MVLQEISEDIFYKSNLRALDFWMFEFVLINENDNDEDKEPVYKFYKKYWGVIPLGIIKYLVIITSRAFALSEIKVLMEYKYFSPIKLLIIYGIIGK